MIESETGERPAATAHPRPLSEPSPAIAFEALLSRMRQEGGDAALRYESLRCRLLAFFRLHALAEAEALSDRALDRVARKLAEGTDVKNLLPFTLGVARMIVAECQSQRYREQRAHQGFASIIEQPAAPPEIREFEEEEARLQERVRALRECLARLGSHATHLILSYYDAEGGERIARRQRLAAELGLSVNALRNRALRLRSALERCQASSMPARRDRTTFDHTPLTTTDNFRCLMDIDGRERPITCPASSFTNPAGDGCS